MIKHIRINNEISWNPLCQRLVDGDDFADNNSDVNCPSCILIQKLYGKIYNLVKGVKHGKEKMDSKCN